MFQANGSLLVAPPFPRPGPGEPGSPSSTVLWRRYDFPPARTRSLMVSVPGSTRSSGVRVRQALPTSTEDARRAWGIGQPAPRFRLLHPWARAGSLRFPGDPSYAYALFQDPGRADRTSPMAVLTMPPPVYPNRRPQRVHNLGADAGLQHPLSTLHERRHRRPCKTRFRLAGCASTGRGSNPLDRNERFQVTSPFSSPELALTQGHRMPRPQRRLGGRACRASGTS